LGQSVEGWDYVGNKPSYGHESFWGQVPLMPRFPSRHGHAAKTTSEPTTSLEKHKLLVLIETFHTFFFEIPECLTQEFGSPLAVTTSTSFFLRPVASNLLSLV